MTWASRASRASRRPTSTAAFPPTPASTSSNTNVGTGSAPAKTTSMASMTRDSSPPEAPLASGSEGAPGCAASRISTSSPPCGPNSSRGVTTTLIVAFGMARAVSSAVTSAANRSAASLRSAVSWAARSRTVSREPLLLGGELADPVVVAREFGEPAARLLGPGEHRGQVGHGGRCHGRSVQLRCRGRARHPPAVGADEPGQLGPAFLHHGEPRRVAVQRLHVRGEFGGHVGDGVDGLGQPAGQPGQRRVMRGHRVQGLAGAAEQRHHVAALVGPVRRVAEQGRVRGGRGGVQRVRVGEPLLLGQQRRVLALGRLGLLDLGQRPLQILGLLRPFAGLGGQPVQFGVHLPVPGVGALVVAENRLERRAGELIKRLPLPAGPQQLLLVRLAVHGHQVIGQVGEQATPGPTGRPRRPSTCPRPRPSG